MKQELSFEQWMNEVLTIGIKLGLFHDETTFPDVDTDALREIYYDDGYSPEDAVHEELTADQ